MKRIKKLLNVFLICSLAIGFVACSNKSSVKDVSTKVSEASKAIKSLKANADTSVSIEVAGQKMETKMNMDMEIVKEPITIKIDSKMSILGQALDLNVYLTEEAVYFQDPQTKRWVKTKDEQLRKTFESQKDSADVHDMLKFFEAVEKDLKLEEKDGNYEITYSGNDESVKDIYLKNVNMIQQDSQELLKNMKIENINIKYVIDKQTYLPISCEIDSKMKVSQDGQEMNMDMVAKINYSEINKLEKLELPEEVKNAPEADKGM